MSNRDHEGMRYPSVDQLQDKSHSKYRLIIGVAERAKEIEIEKQTYIEQPINKKSIGLALEEIYTDKVVISED